MTFDYIHIPTLPDWTSGRPLVDIQLYHAGYELTVPVLVDSGADISMMPYDIGLELGFIWEEQTYPIDLGGMMRGVPAFAVLVRGEIAGLPEKALVFAWAQKSSSECRFVLGQMNFFQQYKVTFEGYKNTFDISSRPS